MPIPAPQFQTTLARPTSIAVEWKLTLPLNDRAAILKFTVRDGHGGELLALGVGSPGYSDDLGGLGAALQMHMHEMLATIEQLYIEPFP